MTKELGEFFSAHMKRVGLSQRGLAKEARVSRNTLQGIIKGEREPSPEQAIKTIKHFRMSQDEKIDFHLLSQGYSRDQIERELGRPVCPVSEIKPLTVRQWKGANGKSVIKLRY